MRVQSKVIGVLVLSVFSGLASAQSFCNKSYGFRADVNGVQGNAICSSKAETFLDAAKDFRLSNTGYTSSSAATAFGRFNDVTLNLSYAAVSTTLSYNFVELGISGSFTGANRDASEEMFKEFVKKGDILGKIMKYQAKNSPTSPISGAGGLIPMTAAADFGSSFDTASKIAVPSDGGMNNLIGTNPLYSNYKISNSGDNVSSFTLPLSYTVRNDMDPRRQLILSLPLTQVSVGNAKSYQTGFGVAYRLPLSDNWTITPGAKYSLVGSADRATVAGVLSGSLMSTYVIPMSGYDVAIGNMLGYYQTTKFTAGGYSANPDLKQLMMRNGVMLSQPVNFAGQKMSVEYSLIDSRYITDKPFIDNTQEIAISIGTNRSASSARSFLRAGLGYVRGPGMKGFTANIGYWF